MNLVTHGDGSSNVHRADSIRSPGEWNESVRKQIPYGEVDVVITNPPFGGDARIDDGHILGQYELPSWGTATPRSSMPAEQLFIEVALRFVKPGGHLVIVLPDGILNNPGLRFIRSWLLSRSKLVASVDLPKTTFAASRGINNPSVLIVQRYSAREIRQAERGIINDPYQVFMATPQTSGTDNRVKPIYLRDPDGQERTMGDGQKIIDDEIAAVADAFRLWHQMQPT